MKKYTGFQSYKQNLVISSKLITQSKAPNKIYCKQDEQRDSINKSNIHSSLEKLNINKSSRFYNSLKSFNPIDVKIKKYEKLNSSEIWMMSELSEINTIIDTLIDFDNDDYRNNLVNAVDGVQFIDREKSDGNNIARNKIFELNVAAKLKKSGFNVVLGSTKTDGSIDVTASSKDRDFSIECKRIQNINSLKSNIKKAISQLKINGIKKENSIIALDFTKIFWKENLDNGNIIPDGELEARKILELAENSYFNILTTKFKRSLNDVLVFLCHIRVPINKTSSGPKFQRHFFTISGNNINKDNLMIFREQLRNNK